MMYTKKELRDEIDRIKVDIYRKLDFDTRQQVYTRLDELLEETKVNTTKNGTVRHYLPKNVSYDVVDNYLECLINSMYDTIGYCF